MNKNSPKVTIVVNSYCDLHKLQWCIEALKKVQYNNREIIVVSYGIPETNIKTTEISHYVDKLILLKKDLGPSAQRNIGFNAADPHSEYVLFVDDDVMLSEITVKNLIRVMMSSPKIGIAQPLLITPDGLIDCAGAYIDVLGYSYMPLRGKPAYSLNPIIEHFKISYAASACLILRTNIFRDDRIFQPFDSDFYFNYEDVDLSLRTWMKGFMVVCIPSAIAVHKRGRTAKMARSPANLIYLNTRNKFITLVSILGIKILPLFVFFECLKAIYLFKINREHALSTFSAILWGFKNFKRIILRHKFLIKNTAKSNMLPLILLKPHLLTLVHEFRSHYNLNTALFKK
jgi:GT2 family glycosyltransferase